MVKDKENVGVVIPIEELFGAMDYIYVGVAFMKLAHKLGLKGLNKKNRKIIKGCEKVW